MDWLWWAQPIGTASTKMATYNPDTHEVVPKKDYLDEQIKQTENRLKELKEQKKSLSP